MVDGSADVSVQIITKKTNISTITAMLSPKSPRNKRKSTKDGDNDDGTPSSTRRGSDLRRGSGLMLNGGLNLNSSFSDSTSSSNPSSPRNSISGRWDSLSKNSGSPRGRKNQAKAIDYSKMYFTTITEALNAANDGDEIHVYAKIDGSPYRERLVIEKSVMIKGCQRTASQDEAAHRAAKSREQESPDGAKEGLEKKNTEKQKSGQNNKGELANKLMRASKLVGGLVQSLKDEAEEDKATEREKALSDMYKSKGQKIKTYGVIIEYADDECEEPIIRCCAKNVRLVNMLVKHSNSASNSLFCGIFVSFGTLRAQQLKVTSNAGDGVYVTQGGRLVAKQGCTFGPCAKNGVLVEGLCSDVEIVDCELRGNGGSGIRALNRAEIMLQKNRINSNVFGIHIGNNCPADIMQNAFENNKNYHLFVNAPWFPVEEHDMINISNVELEDDVSVSARLNTIKSTKTWKKGRKYSLHGTQAFMDVLTEKTKEWAEEGGGDNNDSNE